jgi:hypothetical protein
MRPAILRICAAVVIFPFAVILHPSHIPVQNSSQNDNPTENRVWLAVEGHSRAELLIEPIATVEDSVLTPVQISCLSDALTPEDFSSKYLESGRKYALLFGGASVGEGQVGEQNRGAATASLTYAGSLKIRGQVRALATNREPGDFRVASREPATAEQRSAALALAKEIFSQHGIREALLPKVRAEYVTRTYLAPSPQPSLIGSFSLDAGDNEGRLHSIFLVASQPGEQLQPEFLWIHLSESETDEEHLRFVDHADLFGNGQDEVVAKLVSLETQTHRYVIFRRTKDGAHGEQIFRTEPLGCSL